MGVVTIAAPVREVALRASGLRELRRRLEPHAGRLALVYGAVVALLVYWPVLGYSFILDDALDLTRTETESFRALLGPLPGYAYYRPVPFILWKALRLALGRYDPVVLHLLPLAAHILSGWLVFLLLYRLTGSLWALLPQTFFLVYPFSYQAVHDLGSLFHPLVTLGLLAVAYLWYEGRRRGSWLRLAAGVVIAILALWTHEYGVGVLPLLALLEALFWYRGAVRRPTLWLLPVLAAELLYLRLWFTMDKPQHEYITHADMRHNLGVWLEGFAYPVTAQASWLARVLGLNPFMVVYVSGSVAILAVLALCARRRRLVPALLALGVSLAAFLPAVPMLTYEYVQNSPRLLYIAAPGCVAFWGLLPLLRFPGRRANLAWRSATLALAALVVLQSVVFIHRRNVMEGYASSEARQIIALGAAHPGGELLLVNVPAWFGPWRQEYPIGHLGVQAEPSYVPLPVLVYTGSGVRIRGEARDHDLDPNAAGWRYSFGAYGNGPMSYAQIDARLRAGATLGVVDLQHDHLAVRDPGSLAPNQPPPASRLATIAGAVALTGADVQRDGDLVTVDSRWYVERALALDCTLAIQLLDDHGRVVAEQRGYPLRGLSPPRLWQPGDAVEDRLVLDLGKRRPDGPLHVQLALIGPDGAPLPLQTTGGLARDGWVVVGP